MNMKYYEVILSGMVQGVGFRYFIYRLAQELNIKGYVKNLSNGDVKVIAGHDDPDTLEQFVQQVTAGPAFAKVVNTKINQLDEHLDYSGFSIKY